MKIALVALMFSYQIQAFKTDFDHVNPGCPENSTCSVEMGQYFQRFTKILTQSLKRQNLFKKEQGIPFRVWTTPNSKNKKLEYVEWDSRCKNHQIPDQKIYTAIVKTKQLNEHALKKHIILRKALLVDGTKYQEYRVPRGDSPLYLDGRQLVYQKSYQGQYYGLSITRKGMLTLVKPQTPKRYARRVKCTPEQEQAFAPHLKPKNLYSYAYCLHLWNIKKKVMETMILGRDCD